MASRSMLLPVVLAVCACWTFLSTAFVGSARTLGSTLRGSSVAQGALPVGAIESSLSTSLAVTQAAWGANIVLVVVPITFWVILFLQSERNKNEENMAMAGKGKKK